jgi:hypothetical protein
LVTVGAKKFLCAAISEKVTPMRYVCLAFTLLFASHASAQIVAPQASVTPGDPTGLLRDQLINRLHATREDQRDYLELVVRKVREGELEAKLVVAVQRYAIRRHDSFPFPFFERAMRYEAAKRRVALPTVDELARSVGASRSF